jgi:DNA-binding LacI/PurR family transcriptional regulator
MQMRVTIDVVAQKAGVSKTTVSRILNGNYSQATEETKQRVQEVIRQLNYHPNPMARGLKQMKTNIIGIVLSNLSNPFWAIVLEGVEDTCRLAGYSLMICNSSEDSTREAELFEDFQLRQVDGIIVNPTVNNKDLFEELERKQYPLVAINRKIEGINIDYVVADNIKGAKLAVNHFVENGRKNIVAFVYQPNGVSTWSERVAGFKEALSDHGIAVHERSVIEVQHGTGKAKEAVVEYFKSSKADAVFSTNNMMTLEILEGFKELNIRVPEDVALIGYDETVWAKHLNPPLTTVKQPAYEMGVIAAKNLIKKIQSKTKRKPKIAVLEPELIIRQSCGR